MKQNEVQICSRLAEVTVIRALDGRGRQRFECRTSDTGRSIRCTAARLRPMPPPAVRRMVERMVEAAAAARPAVDDAAGAVPAREQQRGLTPDRTNGGRRGAGPLDR